MSGFSPGLPASALEVLERAGESFSEKPIVAATTKSLTALSVRQALQNAAQRSKSEQVAACVYDPGHAEALVVLKAKDLGELADLLKRAENGEEGRDA